MSYKQVLRPILPYGMQIWGCTKQSNIKDNTKAPKTKYEDALSKHLGKSETMTSSGTWEWKLWVRCSQNLS